MVAMADPTMTFKFGYDIPEDKSWVDLGWILNQNGVLVRYTRDLKRIPKEDLVEEIFSPSTNWGQMGPLIELYANVRFFAEKGKTWCHIDTRGMGVDCSVPADTKLLAAAKAYSTAFLGWSVIKPKHFK